MKKFLPLMLVLLALLPTDVLAVGETCELVESQTCELPYELGSEVNYNLDGAVSLAVCDSVMNYCDNVEDRIGVGSFTYVVEFNDCGGSGCAYVVVFCDVGSASVGNGVPAPALPGSSSGLFDSFDLGLTIEMILSEVVGFLSSSLVASILAAMLALISVPRVLAFFRRMF
jgi:hypothetical protein